MTTSPLPEESGTELILNPHQEGTNKPLILPTSSAENLTAAQRRWQLLKNVRIASSRSSSLTKDEENFLESFQNKEIEGEDKLEQSQHEARASLRKSIHEREHKLTPEEIAFLHELADNLNVSHDHVVNTNQVLLKDPLYNHDDDKGDGEDGPLRDISSNTRSRPSFRSSQIWTSYGTLQSERSTFQLERPQRHSSSSDKHEGHQGHHERPLSFIYKFFLNQPSEHKIHEEEEEEEDNDDEHIEFSILATHAKDKACQPHVLSPPIMDALRPHLPLAVQQDNFWIKYSLIRDGASLRILLHKVRTSARTVLAVETMEGDVFGAFTSTPWRPHGNMFYGSCEAFVWRLRKSRFTECHTVQDQIELESDVEVFDWSRKNRNVQSLVNPHSPLLIGGGTDNDGPKGCAIFMEPNLEKGMSVACVTFDSPVLPLSGDMFEIANVEVWALTPVDQVPLAEKLELGRQFVFDHGNFLQD